MVDLNSFSLDRWKDITFLYPSLLWLWLILPVLIAWYVWKGKNNKSELIISSFMGFERSGRSILVKLIHVPFILRCLTIALLVLVVARPQTSLNWKDITTEGIDIMLSIDISSSMLAKDFTPNRLEASKEVAIEFVRNRPNDRIGLVVFARDAFTSVPLTINHDVLINQLSLIQPNMLDDGTAIGSGLATSVNRLRESTAKSKVVILLTDGVNNSGSISPLTAAEIAKTFGVRVYTIGAGVKGKAYSPVGKQPNGEYIYDYVDVKIDEDLCQKISQMTDGKYFRVTNKERLREVYAEIDEMEKTKIDVTEYRSKKEEFFPFLLLAGIIFIFEWLLRNTIMRSIP
ncbi:MAG: vWA domain-containing protein [Flavobacteriales bacterium]